MNVFLSDIAADQTSPAPPGTETILLVEGEESVRRLLAYVLREGGYAVLEAGTALDGLRLSESYPGPIHALVTNSVMPIMDSRTLADRLVSSRPDLKILLCSGGGDVMDKNAFLQKPFTPSEFILKLRSVLNGDMNKITPRKGVLYKPT